jgi:hypothetical protein
MARQPATALASSIVRLQISLPLLDGEDESIQNFSEKCKGKLTLGAPKC